VVHCLEIKTNLEAVVFKEEKHQRDNNISTEKKQAIMILNGKGCN